MVKEDDISKQYIKMTQEPVFKLIIIMGIPAAIGMIINNIYNMADTYFVSTLGTSASGAVGIVFALMSILQAIGFMLGHGTGLRVSRHLGNREIDTARTYFATGFLMSVLGGIVVLILGMIFRKPMMLLLGSTSTILPYAMTYSAYVFLAAPAMLISFLLNNVLRYEGKPYFGMIGMGIGSLCNIFGDYLLVSRWHKGIAGAGISTAVSQYIGVGILLIPFLKKQVQSRISLKHVKLHADLVSNILAGGAPNLTRQGLNCLSALVLNHSVACYGDAAVAAMSIVSRVIMFLFGIGLGIGQGFQPVGSFNYGAQKYDRVKKGCIITYLLGMGILGAAAIFGSCFARQIITLFRNDPEVIQIGTLALQLQSISLLFIPASLCGNMLFQSVGENKRAVFLSSTRSGLFYIPILLVLSRCLGILGVQIAQPIADVLSSIVAVVMLIRFFRQMPETST